MRKISQEELNEILRKYQMWLNDEEGGEKADLSYANLRYANLRYADLRYVNLRYADLRYVNLRYADLRYADLRYADLRYANLRYANLSGADLRYADLRYADLNDADLRYANLSGADLRYANLSGADLRYANLSGADLSGADLRYINTSSISGLNIISVQINTSRKNNMISYWKELDIVTTGCFQGTLEELKKQVQKTHKDNDNIRNRYEKAIEFIEYMSNDYDRENN